MQARPRPRTSAVAALVALLLVGCGSSSTPAGQAAQGAQGDAGPVAVRNAVLVLGPVGSSAATVAVTFVNHAAAADALTGIEVAGEQPWAVSLTGGHIELPPGRTVTVGYRGDDHINLYGYDPPPGFLVAMTFVFRDHGRVLLQVKALPATGALAGIAAVPSTAPPA